MIDITQIVAAIHVDTIKIYPSTLGRIIDVLIDSPDITGDDGDASVFINQQGKCNIVKDGKEYNTRAVITVVGILRGRTKKQTMAEWKAFLSYLKKNLYVESTACTIV